MLLCYANRDVHRKAFRQSTPSGPAAARLRSLDQPATTNQDTEGGSVELTHLNSSNLLMGSN